MVQSDLTPQRLTSLDDLLTVATGRAFHAFHAALRAEPSFPAAAAGPVRARLAQLLGLQPVAADAAPADELTECCIAYAERFLLDANAIDAAAGSSVAEVIGDAGLVVLTLWLGVVESEERLRLLLDLAPGEWSTQLAAIAPVGTHIPSVDPGAHPWPAQEDPEPPSVQVLAERYAPAVAAARAAVGPAAAGTLPPRLAELVRLVAAQAVDCRFCRNVRYRGDDGGQLVPEDEAAVLLDGDLGAIAPVDALAVRFARAFFAGRGPIDAALRTELEAAFTRDELVELALVTMRNPAGSKAMIALGLVPAATPLTVL